MPTLQYSDRLKKVALAALITGATGLGGCLDDRDRSFLTSREVLGSDLSYLKQEYGDPVLNRDGLPTYQVRGCDVAFQTEGTKISSFFTQISGSCRLAIDEIQARSGTTIGDILAQMPDAYIGVSCIACGNAADPVFMLIDPGARYNGFINVTFSTSYQAASGVIDGWPGGALQMEDSEPRQTSIQCAELLGPEVLAAAKMLPIESAEAHQNDLAGELTPGNGSSFCQL